LCKTPLSHRKKPPACAKTIVSKAVSKKVSQNFRLLKRNARQNEEFLVDHMIYLNREKRDDNADRKIDRKSLLFLADLFQEMLPARVKTHLTRFC
jgi:hypothetical protein